MISLRNIFSVSILLFCTAAAVAQTPQTSPGRGGRGAPPDGAQNPQFQGRGGRGAPPNGAQNPQFQGRAGRSATPNGAQTQQNFQGRGGRGAPSGRAQKPRAQSPAAAQATQTAALPDHGIFVFSNMCSSPLAVQGYRVVLMKLADGNYVYLRAGNGSATGQAGYNVNVDGENFAFTFDGAASGLIGFGKPTAFRGKVTGAQITATVGDPISSTPAPSVTLKRVTDFDAPVPNC